MYSYFVIVLDEYRLVFEGLPSQSPSSPSPHITFVDHVHPHTSYTYRGVCVGGYVHQPTLPPVPKKPRKKKNQQQIDHATQLAMAMNMPARYILDSILSPPITVTSLPLSPPHLMIASRAHTHIKFTWTAVPAATSYRIIHLLNPTAMPRSPRDGTEDGYDPNAQTTPGMSMHVCWMGCRD